MGTRHHTDGGFLVLPACLGIPAAPAHVLVTGRKRERRQKLDLLGGCAVWTLKSKAWAAENVSKGKLNINSVHGTGHISLRFATS